jgi:NAD(P)-dependent dehydrogenase (short-subunit alcohol dehydrogenase family)
VFGTALPLGGRVALVTGAGAGIGSASAAALAGAGAAVAVTDVDHAAATAVAREIAASGGTAAAWCLDVAEEDQWVAVVRAVGDAWGPVTVLHSNAAVTSGPSFLGDRGVVDLDVGLLDRVLAVNLRGAVLGCKHVVPGMCAAAGGAIVITSSVKGSTGSAHRTAYSVSKGGLDSLVAMVATGYGKRGVRCNAVAPGIVATEALAAVPPEHLHALHDAHLTPAAARPADVAASVVFLASDAAAFITGQVLRVDGGLTAHTAALSPPGSR